jgi:hypothetical protein
MKTFIEKLWWHEKLEISNLKKVLYWSYKSILMQNRVRDLYIIWWKNPWLTKRCWNSDIISKSYFIVDIDIRDNYYKLHNKFLSEAMLFWEINKLIYLLDWDKLLAQYSFLVNSGNWVHIYYCWKELIVWKDITPEEYSRWVKKIYDIFVDYLNTRMKSWNVNYKHLYPDYMCSNIARGTRLPLSYNMKKKYWLPPLKVKFIKYELGNYSELVEKLPILWKEIKIKKKIFKGKKWKTSWKYKEIDINNFSIIEVVKKYTWKDYSKWIWNCPLPWHSDKKPSFSVKVKDNYFNCFAKCWWWNPANFIAKMEWISYWEAIRKLDVNFKY